MDDNFLACQLCLINFSCLLVAKYTPIKVLYREISHYNDLKMIWQKKSILIFILFFIILQFSEFKTINFNVEMEI